ncbi:vitronectin [Tiliqua scincoides]|uniref:vitronectin n=1 Tax=Tiliqua scincoides TaxID=71010 RepID=UPI003461A496
MRLLLLALYLGCLYGAFAAEESCEGRCDKGFDSQKKCQCDDLCMYYQSCCSDYATTCKTKITRGDVFLQPEDEYLDYDFNATAVTPTETTPRLVTSTLYDYEWAEETEASTMVPTGTAFLPETATTTAGVPEEEVLCSGKPFDAFTSLKNGSIYAFRGKYLYELDEKSVRPGYPKLIQEVWGIEGPIDAAFTRINCEGKTYIFKGSLYWRFNEGVLDPEFPRNISDGFKGIPDDVDAAIALPAENYLTSERVYFFKGKKYWSYDFVKQPSREECEQTSPSVVFDHYARIQGDSWEEFFQFILGDLKHSGASKPRYISQGWRGLPGQVDAAMVGRIYVQPSSPEQSRRRSSRRHRKKYRNRRRWGRWNSQIWDWPGGTSSESSDLDWLLDGTSRCQPFQSVYFFVKDKYYRVNLHTRRVDWVYPKYPRPIAKYWLGCPSEEDLA